MMFRLSNVWFISMLSYSTKSHNMCVKLYDMLGFFGSVMAPYVYRMRIERHILTEIFHIPLSALMPGLLCPRSVPDMLGMFAIRCCMSVPAAVFFWHLEKSFRKYNFHQKFFGDDNAGQKIS